MDRNNNNFLEKFNQKGYFCEYNFLSKKNVLDLKLEIIKLINDQSVIAYSDRKGNLRRMEKFTFSSDLMQKLNEKIILFLKKELCNDYLLFKDKVNFKPSGGEGFYAHYDGIFEFNTSHGLKKKGWYEYTDHFVNVLVALDNFTLENGPLQIADRHNGTFSELILNTKRDGSPDLLPQVESENNFQNILINMGDICVFDNKAPHRSEANKSNKERGSIYFTYTLAKAGNLYKKYFQDKNSSTNLNKSLRGEIL